MLCQVSHFFFSIFHIHKEFSFLACIFFFGIPPFWRITIPIVIIYFLVFICDRAYLISYKRFYVSYNVNEDESESFIQAVIADERLSDLSISYDEKDDEKDLEVTSFISFSHTISDRNIIKEKIRIVLEIKKEHSIKLKFPVVLFVLSLRIICVLLYIYFIFYWWG